MGKKTARRARARAFNGKFKKPIDASNYFSWNKNTYKSHENGIRDYHREDAIAYARAFGVTPGWLLFGEGDSPHLLSSVENDRVKGRPIPTLHWDAFSQTNNVKKAMSLAYEYVEIPQIFPLGDLAFRQKCKDDSMVPHPPVPGDFFPIGTDLIFDATVTIRPGDFVLAKIVGEKETVFRRYRSVGKDVDGNELADLVPLNSNYRTYHVALNKDAFLIAKLVTDMRAR